MFPVLALTLDAKGPRPAPSDPKFNLHGNIVAHPDGEDILIQASGITIQQFLAFIMNFFMDRQLVDETGLTGTYDITLRVPSSVFQGPSDKGVDDQRGTALVAATEHAGFKFISKKEPLQVVVVDHIDPPTPD